MCASFYPTEELQRKEITAQLDDEGQRLAKRDGIHFSEVRELRLHLRKLQSITNLWEFTSLTSLDLSANIIKKIEGLDQLVSLTWLNLSFNSIREIEGLDSLQKLEALNLTGNKISVIENLDALERLTHFSIAKNCLEQQDNVLYLRKFKKLFYLSLNENPAFKGDDYKLYITVYFPELRYIDDTLINKEMKEKASIKYPDASEIMRHEEQQKQEAEKAKQEVKLHKDAFVEELNGPHLFKSMLKDDPQAEMLHRVPGVLPLLHTFEQQMVELCTQLFEAGLTEHMRREAEVGLFTSGVTKTKEDFKQQTRKILAEFDRQHRESTEEMLKLSDPVLLKAKFDHCRGEINEFNSVLMTLELHVFSEVERVTEMFDTSISEMVSSFTDTVQETFAQIRDLVDKYHEKVQQITLAMLKNVAEDNLDKDVQDDDKMLFADKDTVMDALEASHGNHMLKINDREVQLETGLNAWKVSLIKEIQDKELKEHRKRLRDILRYQDYLMDCLGKLLPYHNKI